MIDSISTPPVHVQSNNDASPSTMPSSDYDFYAHQQKLSAVLLAWGVGSMILGGLWWRQAHKLQRGIGSQFFVWGAIDTALALNGLRSAAKEGQAYQSGHMSEAEVDQKAQFLRRLLWFNFGLDNLYIIWGGRWMGSDKPHRRGAGIGILIQGAFLWVFDYIYARGIRRP